MTLPPPIAAGRTAEIYPWADGRVLKLIRPGFPPYLADQEELCSRVAYQTTGCAPQTGALLEVGGRRGVVLEYIRGTTVLAEIDRRPYRAVMYGALLGRLHALLHAAHAPELPSLCDRYTRQLRESACLPPDLKPPLLRLLERLPDGDRLCHNDFHTYNVILSPRGPVVVDWESAARGSPAADVARTMLKTRTSTANRPGPRGCLYRRLAVLFNFAYLRAYRQETRAPLGDLRAWTAVRAGLVIQDDNRAEWPLLEKIIRSQLDSR